MLHGKQTQVPRKKTPLKKHVRNVFFMTLGSLIISIGFLIFITPNNLLSGGVWGIAAILHYYLAKVPIGVFLLILNIPLVLWGWSKLDLRFAVYTVFAILLQSVLLIVLQPHLPTYTTNPLLACLFGGLFSGIGSGLVVRYHGSSGGTDIVGIILKNKYDLSVGTVVMISNVVIVGCAAFVFGMERAMYTLVNLFISSVVFNQVLEGMNRKRNMMIISEHGDELAQTLIREVGRGVTVLKGEGAYTHRSKDVLFCVISRFELAAIKEIISEVDPSAFVCINETYEVMGRFFKGPRNKRPTELPPNGGNLPRKPEPDMVVVGAPGAEAMAVPGKVIQPKEKPAENPATEQTAEKQDI